MNKKKLYLEWDIHNWGKALPLWDEALRVKPFHKALELGSRNGGLSLWLAENYGLSIICSDLTSPAESAGPLHAEYKVSDRIEYKAIDITSIDFEDNTFDVVIFKSVLGALGTYGNQEKAMREIYRVLKPGGVFLFAENLKSSWIHVAARRLFVVWGKRWRYVKVDEMLGFLKMYKETKVKTAGFTSILLPEKLKGTGYKIDDILDKKNIMKGLKYIIYGWATKA